MPSPTKGRGCSIGTLPYPFWAGAQTRGRGDGGGREDSAEQAGQGRCCHGGPGGRGSGQRQAQGRDQQARAHGGAPHLGCSIGPCKDAHGASSQCLSTQQWCVCRWKNGVGTAWRRASPVCGLLCWAKMCGSSALILGWEGHGRAWQADRGDPGAAGGEAGGAGQEEGAGKALQPARSGRQGGCAPRLAWLGLVAAGCCCQHQWWPWQECCTPLHSNMERFAAYVFACFLRMLFTLFRTSFSAC